MNEAFAACRRLRDTWARRSSIRPSPTPHSAGRRGGGGFRSPYPLVLNGGTDIEYTGEQICAGDTLTSATALASLQERWSGALGVPMLIQVSETTYTNQHGQVVAVSRGTGISYPAPSG